MELLDLQTLPVEHPEGQADGQNSELSLLACEETSAVSIILCE
jgi:hypothetical protein